MCSQHSNYLKAPLTLLKQENFYGWSTLQIYALKFELQYEWTPSQIFSCGYRVLQLLCHNGEEAHDIKCSQK